jgi:hypothetical protein
MKLLSFSMTSCPAAGTTPCTTASRRFGRSRPIADIRLKVGNRAKAIFAAALIALREVITNVVPWCLGRHIHVHRWLYTWIIVEEGERHPQALGRVTEHRDKPASALAAEAPPSRERTLIPLDQVLSCNPGEGVSLYRYP